VKQASELASTVD